MLDSIYIGLTGLTGFSRDLSVIGNNVANINTVGFKGQQTLFSDLFYKQQFGDLGQGAPSLDVGSGLGTAGTRRVFRQGELRQTSNDTDVAINGNGFFVLRRDDQTFYTRAGQFNFDADGWLVSTTANARVAALNNGALRDINIGAARTNPGAPTTKVSFSGTLNNNASADAPYTVSNVQVFDTAGLPNVWSVSFTNNSPTTAGSWKVEVRDAKGVSLASGDIRFGADGNPTAGFNELSVPLAVTPGETNSVTLSFGEPGSISGTRSLSASSSEVRATVADGYGAGASTKVSFDEGGQIVVSYSNGQTAKFDRLALASFNALQGLRPLEGSLFAASPAEAPLLGVAGEGAFGSISASAVELASVDLAQEFSNLIVTQRGYQASSQIVSTANEMIQQLFDVKARR